MSTANLIPETWGLTGDEAKDTLARVGRRRLIGDALKRLRFSDGFSHARSMAFLGILLFVEGGDRCGRHREQPGQRPHQSTRSHETCKRSSRARQGAS